MLIIFIGYDNGILHITRFECLMRYVELSSRIRGPYAKCHVFFYLLDTLISISLILCCQMPVFDAVYQPNQRWYRLYRVNTDGFSPQNRHGRWTVVFNSTFLICHSRQIGLIVHALMKNNYRAGKLLEIILHTACSVSDTGIKKR